MEARFIEIGKDTFEDIVRKSPKGYIFPEGSLEEVTEIRWQYFIADMCDDYGRTRKEQYSLIERFEKFFGDEVYCPFH